jgi:type VI secretion system protein ImpM
VSRTLVASRPALGLYGKLPCAGDFITRSLPAAFVALWDDWLQRCMAASRAKLGSRWNEIYLQSPVWRFSLQPQACGPQAWAGVLMPSVDRAGRYYPLTLAAPIPPAASTLLTVTAADHWYGELERIALWSLKPEATLDQIEGALSQLALIAVPDSGAAREDWDYGTQFARWWAQPGRPFTLRVAADRSLPALAEFAAAHLMESPPHGRSMWWSSDGVSTGLVLRGWQGMPPAADYVSLLLGGSNPDR